MKTKRIIAALLAVSMLLMFAGCGKKPDNDDTSTYTSDRVLYPDSDDESIVDTDKNGDDVSDSSDEDDSEVTGSNSKRSSDSDASKIIIKKNSSKEESSSKATSSKKTTSKNTSSKKTTSKNTSSKKTTSKNTSSKTTTSKAVSSKQESSSKVSSHEVSSSDVSTDTETDIITDTDTQTDTDSKTENILVVYFSRAGEQNNGVVEEGNTSVVANMIANYLGADTYEIKPLDDNYPTDYEELLDYAKQEKENGDRPLIADEIGNLDEYDTIFIGYPIWWEDMPMIMYTFLEYYDLSGKTIVPFCTHAGSGESGTFSTIGDLQSGATVLTGFDVPGEDAQNDRLGVRDSVISWLEDLGYGM